MKKYRFLKKLFTACAVVSAALLLIGIGHKTFAFNQNNLMDDVVFDNSGSMSAGDIQNFLNQFPNSCLANYQAPYPNDYFNYGGNVSAATVIARASQLWGINPQVILTTLEKEESLVSGNAGCASWQYNSAMGYACPDSGGCDSSYAGFSQQVTKGSWQLMFNRERSEGNMGWDGDNSVNYPGYFTAGTYARYDGGPTATYDGYATIDGSSVYMSNGATASLYSYTPHFHGNQNFDTIFSNWFGSLYGTPYYATYYSESSFPTINQGQQTTISLLYKNSGTYSWYDSSTAASASQPPVVLATMNPINRCSSFVNTDWYSCNRPTGLFSKVYNSDGSTLSSNQHVAQPGQIVEYDITLSAPLDIYPGTYSEYFAPIREGAPGYGWYMGADNVFMNITVNNAFVASYVGQSSYPVISQNDYSDAYFKFQNNGTATWYDSTTASSAGQAPVMLATQGPLNRSSAFSSNWYNPQRPNLNFSKVYNSDGTTLSSNQHVVQPGQIVEIDFAFTALPNQTTGVYREYFSLIRQGAQSFMVNNSGVYLDVGVRSSNYNASYVSESPSPTLSTGQTASMYFDLKNTGSTTWYDDAGWSPGLFPVHFATTLPINRSSAICDTSWYVKCSRPTNVFTAVYNSDDSTLAANQHTVQPGQIARFSFTIKAPSSNGQYAEYFQPIVEYSPGNSWDMGGVVWQLITVQ